MATTLVSPLPSIHPVLDPLEAFLQDAGDPASDREGQSSVEVQLEVEDTLDSGIWRRIGEFLNPYDYTTDTAKVVLHKALQGVFQSDPTPILSVDLVELPGVMKRYRVKARDVVDGLPVGEFAVAGTARAWNAGHRYTEHGLDHIGDHAYKFLSIRSYNRRVHPLEPISIQFACFTQPDEEVTLVAEITYTDGTEEEIEYSLGTLTAGKAYAIRLPAPGSGYTKPVKEIQYHFTGFLGVSEYCRYKTILNPTPWYRQCYFKNSMGGFESIAFLGKCEEFNTPTAEIFEAQEYPSSAGQLGNTRAFNQRATDSLVLRTGYMGADEARSFRDLLLRNEAWILESGSLHRLILSGGRWSPAADDNYLHALELSARYAWEETAYSR